MILKKELKINAIKNGTVIDHIRPNKALEVLKILNLQDEQITIGMNLESHKINKKGIIKIANKKLDSTELSKIALVAQDASIIIIENYEIKEKLKVKVPKEFVNIAKCKNLNCITNHQEVKTHFYTVEKKPLKVKCKYCERISDNELEIL